MDKDQLINALLENPDLMAELASNTVLAPKLEEFGNDALRNSRDKAIKSNQNYKTTNDELTALMENSTKEAQAAPTPSPTSASPTGDVALLARLTELENERKMDRAKLAESDKRSKRDAALAQLPFKEGGMAMAQQVISLDLFDVQPDGSVRHKENAMSVEDYVQQDWSKTPAASLLLDSSANGGGGASGTRKISGGSLKKYSDATPTERNSYAQEHGVDGYRDWQSRG